MTSHCVWHERQLQRTLWKCSHTYHTVCTLPPQSTMYVESWKTMWEGSTMRTTLTKELCTVHCEFPEQISTAAESLNSCSTCRNVSFWRFCRKVIGHVYLPLTVCFPHSEEDKLLFMVGMFKMSPSRVTHFSNLMEFKAWYQTWPIVWNSA
jgi:hypothetical protein